MKKKRKKRVDFTLLVPLAEMRGDDEAETAQLRAMHADAEKYLRVHEWCPPIRSCHFGLGVGGFVALFLFEFETPAGGTDDRVWVVTGDLPRAYFVVDRAPDPILAVAAYCDLMEDWVEAVRTGGSLAGVFPVAAEPTLENARLLEQRIDTLREFVELMEAGGVPPDAT